MSTIFDIQQRQALARFVVGESEQPNPIPSNDFAGLKTYNASGVPTSFTPVGNSGYTVGTIQCDFGQRSNAANPFLDNFVQWATGKGVDPFQFQNRDALYTALTSQGDALTNSPSIGLNKNTVLLMNQYLSSNQGNDWINTNLINTSIGVTGTPYQLH